MKRQKTDRSPTAPLLSGTLGSALTDHARKRCVRFFQYLYAMKMLCHRLRALGAVINSDDEGVEVIATEQVDSGSRSKDPGHENFDETDANVVHEKCTAFKNMDAAHFCNLGIKATFVNKVNPHLGDADVRDLFEFIKRFAGDTEQLPQRVNIGPDRIIDQLHGRLARLMLTDNSTPIITRKRIEKYQQDAIAEMEAYEKSHRTAGNAGIAECAQCYVDEYKRGTRSQGVDFMDEVYGEVQGQVVGECSARGNRFDATNFVS